MRKAIALLFLLVIPISAIISQTSDEWYIDKPITGVVFEGLSSVNSKELDGVTAPYINKKFTNDLFWELQDKLYALDYFETIQPNAVKGDEAGTTVIVKFVVVEKASVASVEVKGNKNLRTADILDVVTLKTGDLVNRAKLRADEVAIKKLYLEKGYPDITVVGSIEQKPGQKKSSVRFVVDEGSQVLVKSIKIQGNTIASEATLKGVITLKEKSLFNAGAYQESKLEEDKTAVINFYRDRGYVDAKITDVLKDAKKDPKDGKNYISLTFYIEEGKKYFYGGMDFTGNKIFATEKLKDLVHQQPGSILSNKKLEADFQRVADLYYENGYIFNSITRTEKRDEDKNTINYTIVIVERERAHIENILIKGNKKTKEFVIRREMPLEVGDIFSKAKVIQGLRNLYNLQYFSNVTPETPQGSADNLMDLVINVEEQSTANINFGVTYTPMVTEGAFPISATVKWADTNFMGNGQNFSIETVVSPTQQTLTFGFAENWLMGKRITGGINLALGHNKISDVPQDILTPIFQSSSNVADPFTSSDDYTAGTTTVPTEYTMTYDKYSVTLTPNAGFRVPTPAGLFSVGAAVGTGVSMIWYDPTVNRPADPTVRKNWNQLRLNDSFAVSTSIDSRDLSYNPSSGYFVYERGSVTGILPNELYYYLRTDSIAEIFFTLLNVPITDGWNLKAVLGFHTGYSQLFAQLGRSTPQVDTTQQLYINGMTMGRGWEGKTTPTYGNTIWENSAEFRIPINEQFIWLDSFFDAATIWADKPSAVGLGDFYFSFGAGLRFSIPQFPFRFYLAKRFKVSNNTIQWQAGSVFADSSKPHSGLDFVFSLPMNY
jgi:outer membrane protein insertion porin family